jgi:hypothetical protein
MIVGRFCYPAVPSTTKLIACMILEDSSDIASVESSPWKMLHHWNQPWRSSQPSLESNGQDRETLHHHDAAIPLPVNTPRSVDHGVGNIDDRFLYHRFLFIVCVAKQHMKLFKVLGRARLTRHENLLGDSHHHSFSLTVAFATGTNRFAL